VLEDAVGMRNVPSEEHRSGDAAARSSPSWAITRAEQAEPGIVALVIAGEFDRGTYDAATGMMLRLEAESPARVVLDLSSLTFLSTSGIRFVLEAHWRSTEGGWTLSLIPPPAPVDRLFGLLELEGLIEADPPGAAAVLGG